MRNSDIYLTEIGTPYEEDTKIVQPLKNGMNYFQKNITVHDAVMIEKDTITYNKKYYSEDSEEGKFGTYHSSEEWYQLNTAILKDGVWVSNGKASEEEAHKRSIIIDFFKEIKEEIIYIKSAFEEECRELMNSDAQFMREFLNNLTLFTESKITLFKSTSKSCIVQEFEGSLPLMTDTKKELDNLLNEFDKIKNATWSYKDEGYVEFRKLFSKFMKNKDHVFQLFLKDKGVAVSDFTLTLTKTIEGAEPSQNTQYVSVNHQKTSWKQGKQWYIFVSVPSIATFSFYKGECCWGFRGDVIEVGSSNAIVAETIEEYFYKTVGMGKPASEHSYLDWE